MAYSRFIQLCNIKKNIDVTLAWSIYKTMILPVFGYCSHDYVLDSGPVIAVRRLQTIQNKCLTVSHGFRRARDIHTNALHARANRLVMLKQHGPMVRAQKSFWLEMNQNVQYGHSSCPYYFIKHYSPDSPDSGYNSVKYQFCAQLMTFGVHATSPTIENTLKKTISVVMAPSKLPLIAHK